MKTKFEAWRLAAAAVRSIVTALKPPAPSLTSAYVTTVAPRRKKSKGTGFYATLTALSPQKTATMPRKRATTHSNTPKIGATE